MSTYETSIDQERALFAHVMEHGPAAYAKWASDFQAFRNLVLVELENAQPKHVWLRDNQGFYYIEEYATEILQEFPELQEKAQAKEMLAKTKASMLSQLEEYEKKLIQGGQVLDKAVEQESELRETHRKIEEQKQL